MSAPVWNYGLYLEGGIQAMVILLLAGQKEVYEFQELIYCLGTWLGVMDIINTDVGEK